MKHLQGRLSLKEKQSCTIPLFFKKQTHHVMPIAYSELFEAYGVGQSHFARFLDPVHLHNIKQHLIEVDISEECRMMQEESYLEITVPVLGAFDLLNYDKASPFILHSSLAAVNGYGAKQTTKENFPFAEFINVIDIVDNRYEILVDNNGAIELPQNGLGLFTVIKEITYILSARQVLRGEGLDNCQLIGIHKNKLYLLPPVGIQENYTCHVCVTHIDGHRRIVDSIKPISVMFSQSPIQFKAYASCVNNQVEATITLESKCQLSEPMVILAELDDKNIPHCRQEALQQWVQHPIHANQFLKQIGLSAPVLYSLINKVYNEFEFLRDFLAQKTFLLSQQQGYNNAVLRPEAFKRLYELFVHDVVKGYIFSAYLEERIDRFRLSELAITEIESNFHDSIILSIIESEFQNGQTSTFFEMLALVQHSKQIIKETFRVEGEPSFDITTNVKIDLFVGIQDSSCQEVISNFIDPIQLEAILERSQLNVNAIHLTDVMDSSLLILPTPGIGGKNPGESSQDS